MRSTLVFLATAVALLAPLTSAEFRVLQPIANAKQYQTTKAQFGLPHYGGSITGQLFYGTPGDTDGCTPFHSPGSGTAPWQEAIAAGQSVIVMVDRGDNCTFVQKIRNGQDAAATAVVVVDNIDEPFLPVMADDGTGNTIHIPSILMSMADGTELKALVTAGTKVMVQLSWEVPATDLNMEWEYWMTSNDDSKQFKHDFKSVADSLGDRAHMNAHYLFIPGSIFGCTLGSQGNRPCGKQCTNEGRYCAQDPEHDTESGEDGEDVVQENLRQMCIFKAMDSAKTMTKYWDYIDLFYQKCVPDDATFNKACSETQQNVVGINVATTNTCVTNCGGTEAESGINSCIDAEIAAAADNGVHVLPSVFINNRLFNGRLSCPAPTDLSTCGVLTELCQGYAPGFIPSQCSSKFCWEGLDECGVCGGSGLKDECGTCLTEADKTNGNWNAACTGCDGKVNGKKSDDCGVCGGNGSFDACGACLQADDSRRQTDAGSCNVDSGSISVTAIIVSIIMLVIGGGVGLVYMNKREARMKDEMESVLARYMPLDNAEDFSKIGSNAGEKAGLLSSI